VREKLIDIFVVVLLIALTFAHASSGELVLRLNDDVATYLGLSDSLLETHRYEFNYKLHTKFPPLLPLALACAKHFGFNTVAHLHSLLSILGGLGLLASYLFLKKTANTLIATASVLILATSPFYFTTVTRWILAEPLYLFVSFSAMYFWTYVEESSPSNKFRLKITFCAFAMVLSVLSRSTGFLLVVSGLCCGLSQLIKGNLRKSITMLIVTLPAFACATAWQLYVQSNEQLDWPGQFMHSYVKQIALLDPHQPSLGTVTAVSLLSRIATNLIIQSAHFTEVVLHLNWVDPLWFSPFILLPIGVVCFGFITRLKSQESFHLYDYVAVLYLGILLTWPFDEHIRFILPICPLLLLYFASGVSAFLKLSENNQHPVNSYVGGAAVVIGVMACLSSLVGGFAIGWQAKLSILFWFATAISTKFVSINFVKRHATSFGFVALTLLVAFGAFKQYQLRIENIRFDGREFEHYRLNNAAEWLREKSDPRDTVMATQSGIIHFLTKRKTIEFPISDNSDLLINTIEQHKVTLLLIEKAKRYEYFIPNDETKLAALRIAHANRFERIMLSGNYQILKVVR